MKISRPSAHNLPIYLTIGYFGAFTALGMTAASLGPTLPGLAEHTRSGIAQISFLFTGRSLGYLLGSLGGGRYFDRLPGHPIIVAMLVGMAIMMALVPSVPLLWLLTIFLVILGLAEGVVDVGVNTLLVWVHRQRVDPFMNALHFFFGLGAFLAPIFAAQALLRTADINWVYWLIALYLIPIALWLVRLPSPRIPLSVHTEQAAISKPILVGLIVLFFILYVGVEVNYGGWIFTYTTQMGLAQPVFAAYLTSIFWGMFTVGRLVGVWVATRLAPQVMLVMDLFGCLVSIILILIYPGSLTMLIIGTAGLGFAMASMFPSMLVYAGQQMTLSGRINSLFFVGAGAGAMVLPWLVGQLIEKIGPQVVIWTTLLNLLAIGTVFAAIRLYNRRQRDKRQFNAV